MEDIRSQEIKMIFPKIIFQIIFGREPEFFRPRDAPTGAYHEPFISPGPSGPGSGASLMLMMLAWGGPPRGRKCGKYIFFCVLREKLFKNSSLWLPCMHAAPNLGESMFFSRKPWFRRVLGVCFATFGPHSQAADANDVVARAHAEDFI